MEVLTERNSTLVMLIDDSVFDVFINKKVLYSYGNEPSILEFSTGIKALEYLKAHQNEPDKLPEIIFLDIYMPYMNGFEFLEEYTKLPKSIKSNITLFMLSSSLDPGDIKQAEENKNVKQLFQKPMTKETLQVVADLLCLHVKC